MARPVLLALTLLATASLATAAPASAGDSTDCYPYDERIVDKVICLVICTVIRPCDDAAGNKQE
jgi:hypothetical protein